DAPAIDQVAALPDPTFYGGACTKEQALFTASAAVSDPAGVASVTLFYRYVGSGTVGAWLTAAMAPAGGNQYTVNVTNDADEVYKQLGGADGIVEFYVQ